MLFQELLQQFKEGFSTDQLLQIGQENVAFVVRHHTEGVIGVIVLYFWPK